MDLLLVPYSSDPSLKIIQWPPFLLASKVDTVPYVFFYVYLTFSLLGILVVTVNNFSTATDSNSIGYGCWVSIQRLWPLEAYLCRRVHEMCSDRVLWIFQKCPECSGGWRKWEKVLSYSPTYWTKHHQMIIIFLSCKEKTCKSLTCSSISFVKPNISYEGEIAAWGFLETINHHLLHFFSLL